MLEWLNQLTTYKLMRYNLGTLIVAAAVVSLLGYLPYDPIGILANCLFFIAVCYGSNLALGKMFKTQSHTDSAIITGMILTLLFTPVLFTSNLIPFGTAAIAAMISKYVLVWNKRHVFNPAATGAVVAAVATGLGASWWVGDVKLLPFVIVGGLLIVRKMNRWPLVLGFLALYELLLLIVMLATGGFDWQSFLSPLTHSPLLFFATVMLIEPLTSPSSKREQLIFAVIVGAAFALLGSVFTVVSFPLEAALLIANIYAAMIRKTGRLNLKLREKKHLNDNIYAFIFTKPSGFNFTPGQFLEWSLPHPSADSRGVRRYFTISASPTEPDLMLTTKFNDKSSTFKKTLQKLETGAEIQADALEGDFVLPENKSKKLVFIAGGIGITPFRSMIKYLVDRQEKRDIVLLHSNKTRQDIVFADLFKQAEPLGVRTVQVLTEEKPANWPGRTGFIDEALIKKEVADWQDRVFYVSGPEPMVEAFEKLLAKMGLKDSQIKRDFFPGYTDTYQKA